MTKFKKGTIGIDHSGFLCFYIKYVPSVHVVQRIRDNNNNGYVTENFTPIIQNDPVLERAYMLSIKDMHRGMGCEACVIEETCRHNEEVHCIEELKAHFLSQAKKELEND